MRLRPFQQRFSLLHFAERLRRHSFSVVGRWTNERTANEQEYGVLRLPLVEDGKRSKEEKIIKGGVRGLDSDRRGSWASDAHAPRRDTRMQSPMTSTKNRKWLYSASYPNRCGSKKSEIYRELHYLRHQKGFCMFSTRDRFSHTSHDLARFFILCTFENAIG